MLPPFYFWNPIRLHCRCEQDLIQAGHFSADGNDKSNRINTDYFACRRLENRPVLVVQLRCKRPSGWITVYEFLCGVGLGACWVGRYVFGSINDTGTTQYRSALWCQLRPRPWPLDVPPRRNDMLLLPK